MYKSLVIPYLDNKFIFYYIKHKVNYNKKQGVFVCIGTVVGATNSLH